MFYKLDTFLVNQLDVLMLKLQRKGMNLVMVHCWVSFSVLLIALLRDYWNSAVPVFWALDVVVWGGIAIATFFWAKPNVEYQQNWPKAQELSAGALMSRSIIWGRIFWVVLAPAIMLPDWFVYPTIKAIINNLAWLAPTLMFYLYTSTYVTYMPRAQQQEVVGASNAEA